MTIQEILDKLYARKSGGGWIAKCPAHEDREPSLSINQSGGKLLLFCHAGCSYQQIKEALGGDGYSAEVASYDYKDENGNLLYQVVRFEPKTFLARKPDGSYGIKGIRRVPYRLPEVIQSNPVLICEGEKDCDEAAALGFVATCNPGGAGPGKWKDEYSGFLKDKIVFIIADADAPGREHAQRVALSLQGKASIVKSLELPGAKDLAEWIGKGGTKEQLTEILTKSENANTGIESLFKSVGELPDGDIGFLINEIMPEGLVFIGALAGHGKTYLGLSMVKALTTGKSFLGIFTVPKIVPVLYLIPETSGRAFKSRLLKFGIPDSRELFLCRTISEGPILSLASPEILAKVAQMKCVVFLDTAIRFSDAEDENSSRQQQKLWGEMSALRLAGAPCVVPLHHSTKSGKLEDMTLENVLRGSGDIGAQADAVWGIRRDEALYANGKGINEIEIACVKPRDFKPPEPFRVALSYQYSREEIRSCLDEYGDFRYVGKDDREKVTRESFIKAIIEYPDATITQIADVLKIKTYQVRKIADGQGYIKPKKEKWRMK